MRLKNFLEVVKKILKPLPKKDYPVLDTFSFVSVWLQYVMDKSVVSMRDLFQRLNNQGIDLKISNFYKGSKKRDTQVFSEIIWQKFWVFETRQIAVFTSIFGIVFGESAICIPANQSCNCLD
jgi:hypothetical protein